MLGQANRSVPQRKQPSVGLPCVGWLVACCLIVGPALAQTQGVPTAAERRPPRGAHVPQAGDRKSADPLPGGSGADQVPIRIRTLARVPPTDRRPQIPIRWTAFPDNSGTPVSVATPELVQWVRNIVRREIPAHYEDDRKWGAQKEVWDGLVWRREGWRLETKRRKKMVNAGTWTRYAVDLVDPDTNLEIRFEKLTAHPGGDIEFELILESPLDVWGRLSHWVRDVQVVSLSAAADAACRVRIAGNIRVQVNPLRLPPEISLHPRVDEAQVELTYYRVRRISQVGGDFAKYLGAGLRGFLNEKIDDLNDKLVDKINAQIDKRADRLTLSLQDWLQGKLQPR